jgi:alpha-L-fucosidase 2
VYERASDEWKTGIPLGNGHLGVMLWGDGSPLRLTFDRDDLWDLRHLPPPPDPEYTWNNIRELAKQENWEALNAIIERNLNPSAPTPTKLPLGRLEIEIPENAPGKKHFAGRLSLRHAEFAGAIGEAKIRAFVCAQAPIVVVSIYGGTADASVTWRSLADLNPKQAGDLGIPLHEMVEQNGVTAAVQRFPGDTTAVIAWARVRTRTGVKLFCTVTTSSDNADPLSLAVSIVREAAKRSRAHGTEHKEWWARFWQRSCVTIPDKQLETLWYYGLYKLASSSRPGHQPANLQGLWVTDGVLPPWRGDYHANMNVQETYWPVYATNHLDLGEPLYDWITRITGPARERTKSFFGWDGVRVETALATDGTAVPGWGTVQYWPGAATWLAHHLWLHWRYTGDTEFLRSRAYPFFKLCMEFWKGYLETGDDRRLHVPLSHSPEMNGNSPSAWGRDPVIDLSLIKNLSTWLVQASIALDADEGERANWDEIAQSLCQYPRDDAGGLMLMQGVPLTESHRHPSHLMPIFPMHDISVEGSDEDRQCIDASLHRLEHKGVGEWTGWSFPYASLIASRIGRGEMAAYMLKLYADCFVLPNGFHVNGDWSKKGVCFFHYEPFTMEAECAATSAVTEMLLQSWGGTIRLFPSIPTAWRDASFQGFLAEGAITVGAARQAGTTTEVSLVCERDASIRVTGLSQAAVWKNVESARWIDEAWLVQLRAGVEARAVCALPARTRKLVVREREPRNIFGLRGRQTIQH